jgi:hypothetical protein
VLSKDTSHNIDFGKVSVGQKCIKKVIVKNISDYKINVNFKNYFILNKKKVAYL